MEDGTQSHPLQERHQLPTLQAACASLWGMRLALPCHTESTVGETSTSPHLGNTFHPISITISTKSWTEASTDSLMHMWPLTARMITRRRLWLLHAPTPPVSCWSSEWLAPTDLQCPLIIGLHVPAGIPAPGVRLVSAPGVRPGVGEVEVYHLGSWKPVGLLTASDAGVVCRQLGYNAGAVASGHTFRDPTQRPMLQGGGCSGSESDFSSCVMNATYAWDSDDPTYSGLTVACSKSGGEDHSANLNYVWSFFKISDPVRGCDNTAAKPRFSDIELRLANSTASGPNVTGRPEFYHNNRWYTVGMWGWSSLSGSYMDALCIILGFKSGYPLFLDSAGRGDLDFVRFNDESWGLNKDAAHTGMYKYFTDLHNNNDTSTAAVSLTCSSELGESLFAVVCQRCR